MRTVTAGTRISEYVLDMPIGSGAFAEVWRGHHHVWSEVTVAIKLARAEEYVRFLKREGLILHKLDHPNIVRTLGIDADPDPPYIVTEFVPGGSLRDLLRREGRLAPERALSIVEQVLEALAFAHERGFIHRDLKPENILLDGERVKLSDFGLGAVTSELALSSIFESRSGTAGTPLYFSPEQKLGETVDARSDLYSLGIVFFECLTGVLPAGSEMPSELVPGIPAGFDRLFRRFYARREARYQSGREALDDLEALCADLGAPERAGDGAKAPGTLAGSRPSAHHAGSAHPPHRRAHPGTPAGLSVRLWAHAIDGLLFWSLSMIIAHGNPWSEVIPPFVLLHFIYTVIMVGLVGGTIGKLFVGIRVRSADGSAADFFQAFWRYFIAVVTLGVGLLMCPVTPQHRGVHDYVANTVVVWLPEPR